MSSSSAWIEGPEKLSFYTKVWTPSEATGVKASVMFVHGYVHRGLSFLARDDRGMEEGCLAAQ